MADISKINGYDIKDKVARESIDELATVANSGDYNDLENKPFYNNRNLERIELTFDGNFEGKETLEQVNTTFVKITDEVYEEDMKEIEENGILTVWSRSTGDVSSEVSQESYFFEEIEENVYVLSEFIVVALDDVEYSESARYPFTKGIWFGNISNYFILKGLSFNRNTTTISNQSNTYTLDSKGNAWFAGNVSIGEDNKQLATESFVTEQLNTTLDNIVLKKITQAEYDALAVKDPNTLYIIIK